ncbi:XRE family transcriptional regulator [Clostridioides difficile]|nr:XRE family transcriptional regulator [Clostridioides difficile]
MSDIGKRIKILIEKENIKQVEFAEKIKVDQSYISKLLSSKSTLIPSERVVDDICQKFNVNKEWVETGTGEMYIENKCNRNVSEATDLLMELSIEFQECAIKQIKELIKLQQSLKK